MVKPQIILAGIATVLIGSFVFVLVLLGSAWQQRERPAWVLAMLDVGQGDAFFFEREDGVQVLIDGGRDATVLTELARVMPPGDRTIDLVIATHPDTDHIGGLVDVLERYRVDTLVVSGAEKVSPAVDALLAAAPPEVLVIGHPQRLLEGAVTVDAIWPTEAADFRDANESSIVLMVDDGRHPLLFTGDIGAPAEELLLASNALEDIAILKVGHHGSRFSSTRAFLARVQPEIALVSAGADNRFGHPHPSILQRLQALHVQVYRTDEQGTVVLRSCHDTVEAHTRATLVPLWVWGRVCGEGV